jgi:hypothetical protein
MLRWLQAAPTIPGATRPGVLNLQADKGRWARRLFRLFLTFPNMSGSGRDNGAQRCSSGRSAVGTAWSRERSARRVSRKQRSVRLTLPLSHSAAFAYPRSRGFRPRRLPQPRHRRSTAEDRGRTLALARPTASSDRAVGRRHGRSHRPAQRLRLPLAGACDRAQRGAPAGVATRPPLVRRPEPPGCWVNRNKE